MTVDDLRQQIEETERLIAVYRNADEVIVGTQDQIKSMMSNGLHGLALGLCCGSSGLLTASAGGPVETDSLAEKDGFELGQACRAPRSRPGKGLSA